MMDNDKTVISKKLLAFSLACHLLSVLVMGLWIARLFIDHLVLFLHLLAWVVIGLWLVSFLYGGI